MIKYTNGNIIQSTSEALVNTVNIAGVMGKGVALSFKNAFPNNFKIYKKACENGDIDIGKLLITETGELTPKYIINFPTKKHWRNPSEYKYIESGLKDLIRIIKKYKIKSISIPPLGAGNGQLNWIVVKNLIIKYLSVLPSKIEVIIFEPGFNEPAEIKVKNVSLTDARVLFLYALKNYGILNEDTNLLVAQKVAYFMQKFDYNLNLQFEKGYYGPYSHKLEHLLKYLNNSYIDFDDSNNSPSTLIYINYNKYEDIEHYYNNKIPDEQKNKIEKLLNFIHGFESPYGLELLATIDFIVAQTGKKSLMEIQNEITNWTNRKRTIMKEQHIEIAYNRLKEFNFV